ncbi:hypothetical protein AVEN_214317-1, partial [Araneus ventricosus]
MTTSILPKCMNNIPLWFLSSCRKLEELMKHHVVVGRVKTDTVSDDQKVESVDGQNALRLKVYRNVSICAKSQLADIKHLEMQDK